MDHNLPTSSNPFIDDHILLDDEILQLISSNFPANSQNDDVSAVFAASTENQLGQDSTLMVNNSIANSQEQNTTAVGCTPVEFKSPAPAASKSEGKKKSKAVEVERRRRQEMSTLYHDLRSLLPEEYVKRKRSISDLLQEATNYINNLEEGLKDLNSKKVELLKTKTLTGGNCSSNSKYIVRVKACKEGFIEVIVTTSALYDVDDDQTNQSFRLSKVLHLLIREGFNVINCVSSRADHIMVHTIQAQVEDGRGIDLRLLQQTLTDCL